MTAKCEKTTAIAKKSEKTSGSLLRSATSTKSTLSKKAPGFNESSISIALLQQLLHESCATPLANEIKKLNENDADVLERLVCLEQLIKTRLTPGPPETGVKTLPRGDEPRIYVSTFTKKNDIRPASEIGKLVKEAKQGKFALLVNTIDRITLINGKPQGFSALRFDLLSGLLRNLPSTSSSYSIYVNAWCGGNQTEVNRSVYVHDAVKRTINRLNDQIQPLLNCRIAYSNERWRFEPDPASFCLIEQYEKSC